MRYLTRSTQHLLVFAAVITAIGCGSATSDTSTTSDTSDGTQQNRPAGYESEMAVSVKLTDPATGRPHHATMDELEPMLLREAQRIKHEPLLRTILNQPAVQNTEWFDQLDNDLDDALRALQDKVIHVEHVEGTPLLKVYAVTANAEDAQIILTALRDEYMRQNETAMRFASEKNLLAAQMRSNMTEERVTGISASIERFLNNTPIDTLDERSSEAAIQVQQLVTDLSELRKQYAATEVQYQQMRQRMHGGDFDASDMERAQIEDSEPIRQIDRQLLELRLNEAALLAEQEPDALEVSKTQAIALALERERAKQFDQRFRSMFLANFEQSAFNLHTLKEQRAHLQTSLQEWTIKRQEQFRLSHQYKALLRELQAAESQRNKAKTHIADLIQSDQRDASSLGYRVIEQYPPQKSRNTN